MSALTCNTANDGTSIEVAKSQMKEGRVGSVTLISEKIKSSPEEHRGHWTNHFEFILSCVGYTVGLGNIWRFPYLCMRNGGGAFLIPCFLALIFCGIPLFLLEVHIAQFSGLSVLQVWSICPLMKGLGISIFLLSLIVSTYYNTILGWTLYYLIKSFTKYLPWSSCHNSWNTPFCLERGTTDTLTTAYNDSEHQSSPICTGPVCNSINGTGQNNATQATTFNQIPTNVTALWRIPAEEFWRYKVLDITDGIDDLGGIKWDLLGTFVLCWIITFCCVFRGIKTSGKVVYVTATIPYLFITALLIRGVTLPGAIDGIRFYVMPDWKKLLEFQVWAEGMIQIVYTVGPGWGGIITMASYNKFKHNCVRDAVFIPLATSLTGFYGGFVIFSVLGFLAKRAGVSVKDVVESGPGLAFIVYPEAVSQMPISPLWSVCFFCMLLSVGLDSMFGMIETLISGITDAYPAYLRRHKTLFLAGTCIALFLLGIPFVTRGGVYALQLMDWYVAMPVLFVFFFEFITLSWMYGANRIYSDIELMTGSRPSVLWKISWCAISPAILLVITVYTFIGMKSPTYDDYEYPAWVVVLFWGLNLSSVLAIPICSIHTLFHLRGSFLQRVRASMKPSATWGPSDPIVRKNYYYQIGSNISCTSNNDRTDVPLNVLTTQTSK